MRFMRLNTIHGIRHSLCLVRGDYHVGNCILREKLSICDASFSVPFEGTPSARDLGAVHWGVQDKAGKLISLALCSLLHTILDSCPGPFYYILKPSNLARGRGCSTVIFHSRW